MLHSCVVFRSISHTWASRIIPTDGALAPSKWTLYNMSKIQTKLRLQALRAACKHPWCYLGRRLAGLVHFTPRHQVQLGPTIAVKTSAQQWLPQPSRSHSSPCLSNFAMLFTRFTSNRQTTLSKVPRSKPKDITGASTRLTLIYGE